MGKRNTPCKRHDVRTIEDEHGAWANPAIKIDGKLRARDIEAYEKPLSRQAMGEPTHDRRDPDVSRHLERERRSQNGTRVRTG